MWCFPNYLLINNRQRGLYGKYQTDALLYWLSGSEISYVMAEPVWHFRKDRTLVVNNCFIIWVCFFPKTSITACKWKFFTSHHPILRARRSLIKLVLMLVGMMGNHGRSRTNQNSRNIISLPHSKMLYYTILYYTILYYTILYYTILYYTILYYTILHGVLACVKH